MEKTSYLEYEKEASKAERKERRLITVIEILIGILFGTNVLWMLRLFS